MNPTNVLLRFFLHETLRQRIPFLERTALPGATTAAFEKKGQGEGNESLQT